MIIMIVLTFLILASFVVFPVLCCYIACLKDDSDSNKIVRIDTIEVHHFGEYEQ